jgi:hypothetical protein
LDLLGHFSFWDFVDVFGEFCVFMDFLGFVILSLTLGIEVWLIWKLVYLGAFRQIRSAF